MRLLDVQAISADDYAVVGRSQRVHAVELPARRGSILDRNGFELAVSVPRATVWADPHRVRDPAATARALAPVLEVAEGELRARLTTNASFVYLARRVDDATAETVKAMALEGVSLVEEPARVSPAGSLAAPVLGQVGVDDDGLSGLELQFQERLAGKAGELVVERDPGGRDIPGGIREHRLPVRGHHVLLTLDRDLQFQAEQALAAQIEAVKAKSGVAIVMDPRTGEILAMANMVAGPPGSPPRPAAYNKALIDVYEPGSVNKVVTLSAALEEGRVGMSDAWSVPDAITVAGSTFQDVEPHPPRAWTLTDVMAQSSNVGAILVGQEVGRNGLHRYLREFRLDEAPGLDFPGEATGLVPDLDDWSGTTLPTVSIGYGLAVSPLTMLSAYNAIANQGVYVAPRLVRGEIDASGKERPRPASERHRVVSAETAAKVTGMLTEVVRSGTGTTAAIDGYTVAGKTGTARKAADGAYRDGAYVATFAGFFPAESPRLSAIVVLDEPTPYTGAKASAPVFAALARYAARHLAVPAKGGNPTGAATALAATLAPSSATRP